MLSAALESLWNEYLRAESDGLRRVASTVLDRFVEQLLQEPAELWRGWAKHLARSVSDGANPPPVRFPLYTRVLMPALTRGVLAEEPGCARWLASLDPLLSQAPPTELPASLRTSTGLLREALRVDPGDDVARSRLVEAHSRYLEYTLHELPAGVLFGTDGASVEQCDELLELLDEFRSHVAATGQEELRRPLIRKCEHHYRAYASYLHARPSFASYADYLRQDSGL